VHKNKILHRDVKPENLVLDKAGYIYLTDFGIARVYNPENGRDSSGTPAYLAPEVMEKRNYSYTVDYYAVGVIMYEMAVGRVESSKLAAVYRQVQARYIRSDDGVSCLC
jgi:serine/threonine protein kinase